MEAFGQILAWQNAAHLPNLPNFSTIWYFEKTQIFMQLYAYFTLYITNCWMGWVEGG